MSGDVAVGDSIIRCHLPDQGCFLQGGWAVPIMFRERNGIIAGTWDGKPVYVHFDFTGIVVPNSAWLCTLTINPKRGSNYFATPIKEIDREDVREILVSNIGRLMEFAWENYTDDVLSLLSFAISDIGVESTDIGSAEEPDHVEAAPVTEVPDEQPLIEMPGADMLRSTLLTESRYFVSFSLDRSILRLHADRNGDVACSGGSMRVVGLDRLFSDRTIRDVQTSGDAEHRTMFVRFAE